MTTGPKNSLRIFILPSKLSSAISFSSKHHYRSARDEQVAPSLFSHGICAHVYVCTQHMVLTFGINVPLSYTKLEDF